jgi:riboflavin synthase
VFTGLVEEKGALVARTPRGPGARVTIRTSLAPLVLGESIDVDGACLTVASIGSGSFDADCSHETLARTTLGSLPLGGEVNLERAVPLGARMGGHIVSGHVDGTGTVVERRPDGEAVYFAFTMPTELARYVAEKGSICINGVSLTVNAVTGDRFAVTIIPHTLAVTTLGALAPGARVNLEVDVLARYVARLVDARAEAEGGTDVRFVESLKRAGFL